MSVMSAPTTTTTITPSAQRHRLALAIIVTCQLMLIIDATVMNVALPHIQADLHLSTAGLTWVMTSYTLAFGGLLLLGGRAGDVFGRRRMFVGASSCSLSRRCSAAWPRAPAGCSPLARCRESAPPPPDPARSR